MKTTLRELAAVSLAGLVVVAGCTSGGEGAHGAGADGSQVTKPAPTRSFHMRYVTDLEGLPAGETVRLWVPVPHDDPYQTISNLKVEAPWGHRETTESVWGNRMLYFEGQAVAANATVTVEYDVARAEYTTDLAAARTDGPTQVANKEQYLKSSALVVINDDIQAAHEEVTPQGASTLEKARAYYDHVLEEMSYDKSGEGWGRGDSVFACAVGRGNCTDFHSYFQALCMAEGIPTRFSIGMWGGYDKKVGAEYESSGYHCWAEFHVPGHGWIPVDISEADKDPSKADYFFGNHSDNRVTLSTGRDIVLDPPQAGAPLNYFVNPYAEVGGEPLAGVKKTPYWTDLE